MAELAAIPASRQLLAVAWLRWRMFANSFQRRKSDRKSSEIVLTILVRMVVWPILAFIVVGPIAGCGFAGWNAIARHQPETLLPLLTALFFIWQYLGVNGIALGATLSGFDPSTLLRFPIPFGRYVMLRILFGLLTPTTTVGCLCLLSGAVGIGIAKPALTFVAVLAMSLYALANILFARMIAAWLERWLANRKAKEIFGALMLSMVLGIQFFNMRIVPGLKDRKNDDWLFHLVDGVGKALRWLPPGFASQAILSAQKPLPAATQLSGIVGWTAIFLFIYAIRLHKQYLGEYLSENVAVARSPQQHSSAEPSYRQRALLPPVIGACLRKEWLYFRGNTMQVISMLSPLIFIFILSKSLFANFPDFFLPGAIAYALLGLLTKLYNIFGEDGSGVQLYLLAPVKLSDVVLAKNIASLVPILIEVPLTWCIVLALSKTPIPLAVQASVLFWVVFVILINLTVGTLRSIQAPRRFVPGQARQARVPTNRNSSLLVLALFFGSVLLEVPVSLLSKYLGAPWLAILIFGLLAGAAVLGYASLLRRAEQLISQYRDLFAEELCKA